MGWNIVYADQPATLPAWLAGAGLHEWVEITGTSGAGGASTAYSGFAVSSSGDVFFAAAGGHLDSSDNRVARIRLSDAAPSWSTLEAASSSVQEDVAYYADGLPSSRHVYQTVHYVPSLDRIFLTGARFVYGSGVVQYPDVSVYHVGGSAWAAEGTYADVPAAGVYGQVFDGSAIWTQTLRKYVPSTDTWSNPISSRAAATPRYPWAYDSTRSQLFGLCYNDGEGFGSAGTVASKVPIGGTTETAITFNSSAAYTAWQSLAPQYAAMDYDPQNDRFLFYDGRTAASKVVYVITPNSGTTWDMSTQTMTGTAPGYSGGDGVVGRLKYIADLKGFVMLPQASSNLFFFRVA